MDSFELELKQGFLEEASQLLEDTEQYFLALESRHDDKSVIESIFRLAHNFKGSSRAVGFGEMADFSHTFESFLLKIKNGEYQVTTDVVNLLLRCNDHLKLTVDELKKSFEAKIDSSELLRELEDRIAGRWVQADAPAEPVDAEAPAAEEIHSQAAEAGETATPLPIETTSAYPSAAAFEESGPAASGPVVEAVAPVAAERPQLKVVPTPPESAGGTAAKSQTIDESIRVALSKVEKLINNVGELVIMQTVLSQHRFQINHPLMRKTIEEVSKITKEIQDISMSMRMIPLKQTFQKMQRIVRDTSKILGKEVNLVLSGEETELDKTVLENLGDPLVHLIRNAVDHGLESGEDRVAKGKSAAGRIELTAYHRGAHIVIEVRDDGRGLDAQKLKQKAIEKGVIRAGQELSEKECYNLIFAPGFSTKSEVSDISGRGVGLDVVRTNVEKILHGEIQIETELGKGTCFRILLPLTLAIIDAMIIELMERQAQDKVRSERYVIPLGQVFETLKPDRENVHFVSGLGNVLSLRGEEIPLFPLTLLLGERSKPRAPWEMIAMVVREGGMPFAILVDDIIGQQQVVVKRLGHDVHGIQGFSGGAILGDGKAAVILDLVELVGRAKSLSPVNKEAVGWA
jgi:two-component system chemotaxis sensor kinase CheA